MDLRRLAEDLLLAETGATRVMRLCPRCGSDAHGQPRLVGSDLAASIAYAGDLAVVAWGAGPVGVDVEVDGPPVGGVGDRAAWTRLEALAKADGRGLAGWPDVVLPDLPTIPLDLPAGYVGTLAGRGQWRVCRSAD